MIKVVITNKILEAGKSSNGGWSNRQIAILGEKTGTKYGGWKGRLIGSRVPEKNVRLFLELKNAHLKINREKREKYQQRYLKLRDNRGDNREWTAAAQEILAALGKLRDLHNLNRQEIALIMSYAEQKIFNKADWMFLERMRNKVARIGFLGVDVG